MFAAHSVWNREEVMKVVPGAFAFTILRWVRKLPSSVIVVESLILNDYEEYSCRDPVDAFESWYGYTRRWSRKLCPMFDSYLYTDLLPEIWLLE